MVVQRIYFATFLFVFNLSLGSCNWNDRSATNNAFASVRYDKVVAYSYNGEGGVEIIDRNGRLANRISKTVELDTKLIMRITDLLSDESTYGGDVAACFDPHLGIVFYKNERVNAYISICLDCNYLESSVAIPGSDSGFSDAGSRNIHAFQRELGL